MMKTFIVEVREVHVASIEIEANNKEDAIKKISKGGVYAGNEVNHEYSHQLGVDTWSVTEKEE